MESIGSPTRAARLTALEIPRTLLSERSTPETSLFMTIDNPTARSKSIEMMLTVIFVRKPTFGKSPLVFMSAVQLDAHLRQERPDRVELLVVRGNNSAHRGGFKHLSVFRIAAVQLEECLLYLLDDFGIKIFSGCVDPSRVGSGVGEHSDFGHIDLVGYDAQ